MAMEQGKEGGEPMDGKAAVRVRFVRRLNDAGLVRPKGVSEAKHAEFEGHLVEALAYMSADTLDVLADEVLTHAGGGRRNEWLSEVVIRNMAAVLQPRPFVLKPIVSSWLASVEGPMAEMGGYLAELYQFLRSVARPVLPYDLRQIKEKAAENARMRSIIKERQAAGSDLASDREWMDAYLADLRAAQAIVEAGKARRYEKQSGAAA